MNSRKCLNIKSLIPIFTFLFLIACAHSQQPKVEPTTCIEPRPQICTMDYQPVCGINEQGIPQTYANGCSACSDTTVSKYHAGECPPP